MKKIRSIVTYNVPAWNFCNSDNLSLTGELSKHKCKFCIKDRQGVHCTLYSCDLTTNGELINKARACCRATAGHDSVIVSGSVQAPLPTIPPKEVMKQAVDLYAKTLEGLMAQGYPRQMADKAARKYVIGD